MPEAIKSTDMKNLVITAIAAAAFSILLHVKALAISLFREEPKFFAFSVFTIVLGVGDLIGMFVTSLNISDLLVAYPYVSVSRTLVILCCSLALFRAVVTVVFCCSCGFKGKTEGSSIDLINATAGTFAWPMAIEVFPGHLKSYIGKINNSAGDSIWPAVIRSSSFLRMFLLIYLNGVSLVASGNDPKFQRLSIVSVACAVVDFIIASYMWLFWGIWDRILKANDEKDVKLDSSLNCDNASNVPLLHQNSATNSQFLFFLKNFWSIYIMSIMDLASLVVSLLNITDIILLFNGNLRWLVGLLLVLFLIRSLGQLLLALVCIFRIRKHPQLALPEVWNNFSGSGDGDPLRLEFMYLSDCSFNSFVGFVTLLFCPAALVRFFMRGFESIHQRRPIAKSIGLLNAVTVVKSVINIVVCFVAFVNFELPLVQVVILTASLVLSLWRGFLSLAGFLLHTIIPIQLPFRVTSSLWTASFATIALISASIISQPCFFAPKLCQTDDSQCLAQSCDPTTICHANMNGSYACTCPPWLIGNGTGPCSCPYSFFSLPHFDRKTCVNDQVFMSLGDMTCVYSVAFCMFVSSLVWFYEWHHTKRTESSIFKVACCLMLAVFVWIAASYGIFSSRHPTSSSCPSWMIASGGMCSCPLSDYPVPDFERGVCVTSKSHMSQGQVAGVAVGGLVCGAILIISLIGCCGSRSVHDQDSFCLFFVVSVSIFALLFGLVFGLGNSKFFPVPKAACGSSSASFKLCALNAECIDNACVCNAGFIGDGVTCSAGVTGLCDANSTACCPLSDYPVPDFERGVCVTSKSHMSQGQVAGVAVGGLVCGAILIFFFICFVAADTRSPDRPDCRKDFFGFFLYSIIFFALLFGLVFGLGSSKFFPVPKAACGNSSASFKLCDLNAECIDNACSSSCLSWMITSGGICSCPLSDYPVPDFERGVCVTSKSHMSQGQVAGVAVGGLVCGAMFIFVICSVAADSSSNRMDCFIVSYGFIGFYALLFGLVFGLGNSKFFPVPKAACGNSSASFKLCDLNAECIDNACVCNAGFIGDGVTCSASKLL